MPDIIKVAITSVLAVPPKGTDLVIFADPRSYVAELDSHQMLAAAARYAARYKVYLVPERFIAAGSLCLCMLAPDGSVLGVQRACHLNVSMRQLNLARADEIVPFDTPLGRIALLVDVDINMPQTARAAALGGAELIISSQYMPLYDFFDDRINLGTVNAARSNGLAVISAIGMGGVAADRYGDIISNYSENLPLLSVVEPHPPLTDIDAMITADKLIKAHSELLFEPTEVASDE